MKPPKIKPLADRVLIRPLDEEKKSPGGLFLVEGEKKPSTQGVVVVVGKGTKLRPITTVKVGDTVLYTVHSGAPLILEDGHEYLIMRETEISMVLKSAE